MVAGLGLVEKQQQESSLPAWPDEDDDTGGEQQPISSPPGEALSYLTCRADISDGGAGGWRPWKNAGKGLGE